jgi:hypothetical protein
VRVFPSVLIAVFGIVAAAGRPSASSAIPQASAPAPSQSSGPGAALVAGNGSSGVLSASVLFAAYTHAGDDGTRDLDMLVLLRGEAGWYAHTPRGASVLTGATSTPRDGRTVATFWTSGGGFTVNLDTDSQLPTIHLSIVSNKGRFLDDAVDPARTNVVLVDGAGGDGEPKVQTMRIDPRIAGSGSAAALAVRKTARLVGFVQCGMSLPDSIPDEQGPYGRSLRNIVTRSCDEIRGNPAR